MRYIPIFFAGLLFLWAAPARAQAGGPAYKDNLYTILRFSSTHSCFPDTGRAKGWLDGDGIFRPVAGHYDDSSVLLLVPRQLKADGKIDLVFWFHGWHNSIDTALAFYGLARQFAASGRNAVLVLPEAAKNAADSYGGKLQQDGMFKELAGDVLTELKSRSVVDRNAVPGHIVLCGHSGAYGVIANILQHGQLPVDEVFLFDALYGRLPVFLNWIQQDRSHHFIHWFTNHGGGTDAMSDTLMMQLRNLRRDYGVAEEDGLQPAVIGNNPILFVHSRREHNVIINDPDDFRLLLENSYRLRKIPNFRPGP
jgi:hypothetical protein